MLAIVTGVIQKLSAIFIAFFSQWVFIHYLGMEYVSVDGLFSSVLTFLSLAELGVGSAITVYLYKPLAEKDGPSRATCTFTKSATGLSAG